MSYICTGPYPIKNKNFKWVSGIFLYFYPYHILAICHPDDRTPPSVTVNKELEVKEGSEARLTTEFLSASDLESESRTLRFMILEPPRLGHIAMLNNKGKYPMLILNIVRL